MLHFTVRSNRFSLREFEAREMSNVDATPLLVPINSQLSSVRPACRFGNSGANATGNIGAKNPICGASKL